MAQAEARGVALVTGAGRGLGQAISRRLHRDGFQVAANDVPDSEGLRSLVAQCDALPVVGDVSDSDSVRDIVATVEDRLGAISLLVANHAAMSMKPFLEQDPAEWWRQVDVNLTGTFYLCRAVVPGMRGLGGGRIVIIASEAGVIGMANATGYSASKAGLIGLAKSLGRELAREGIIANAIAPSYIDTPQLQVDADAAGISLAEMHRRYEAVIPMGRLAQPAEIAAVVSYLAGPYAGAVVGQVLQPNGGTTRCRA